MRFWRWDIMEIRNSSLNSPKMDRSHRRISWNIHEKFHHLEGLRVITSPRQVDAEAAMALQQGEFKWWWGTRCWWWLMVAAKLTSKNMTICDIYYRCFMIFHDLSFFTIRCFWVKHVENLGNRKTSYACGHAKLKSPSLLKTDHN